MPSSPLVSDTDFIGNTAEYFGGALYWHQFVGRADDLVNFYPLHLRGLTFSKNKVFNGDGGAIYFRSVVGHVRMEDMNFTDNHALEGIGGAVGFGRPSDA